MPASAQSKKIELAVVALLKKAVTDLPRDVVSALEKARDSETNALAKSQLDAILENVKLAKEKGLPMCQDTGVITFFVEMGFDSPMRGEIEKILVSAVKKATKSIPLRPNYVDIFSGKNSGDNTGAGVPIINWSLVKGDKCKIT
ncbi:MAG: fumarate hydratase, partial [Candidatus Thermoplasmatota archaeon]|nr:fumarate hydratase [Candidatus Thermoplasmatota archaeon]